jgi:hypothetical protein
VYGWDNTGDIRALSRRMGRLERKLDLLLDHFGIRDDGPDEFAEVWEMIRADKKLAAIKAYREVTGTGLKEAKDAVERMAAGR